ncbi:MAG: lecithin retinol acyltransferase family protein [Clostridia bacterium]|nr:lecithin retinol acyltransferase family protein [Clostridia bacterium]
MIWWQSECQYGDMIRVCFGNFYHYGIFVSDDEVIQFGLPPTEGLLHRKFDEIAVCVTDIDTFASGKMVEVASQAKGERPKRLSPKKTVSRAKGCIGERGYDILHNNCEHFARYCYLGEKRCEVTERVVDVWKSKSKCDVYFSRIPQGIALAEVFPPERSAEIADVRNERLRLEKYWAWKTLEYALYRSFGYKMNELSFSKGKNGKWLCDKCFFSLSHAGGFVAVAVSNKEIGIDVECLDGFEEKCRDAAFFEGMKRHTAGKRDPVPQTPTELLALWTKKESLFKCHPQKRFSPTRIELTDEVSTCRFTYKDATCLCSVSGSDTSKSFFYYYDGEASSKIKDITWI